MQSSSTNHSSTSLPRSPVAGLRSCARGAAQLTLQAMIFLEAMADGAVMMGLPRQAAVQMAAQSQSTRAPRSDAAQPSKVRPSSCCSPVSILLRSRTPSRVRSDEIALTRSARRLHNRGSAHAGGRQSQIDHREGDPDHHPGC